MMANNSSRVLSIDNLTVSYKKDRTTIVAVDNVSFELKRNQTCGLVGESGSGKTTIALSIPFLLPSSANISGAINFLGENILEIDKKNLYELRRKKISVIFQDALGSLIPGTIVGVQLYRALKYRTEITDKTTLIQQSKILLESVGLYDWERILTLYPHELSGGMCQRVMIALSLSIQPELLIADEPISSLDAVSQMRVLELLLTLQKEKCFSILFVTHDLKVASRFDVIGVLKQGRLLEFGPAHEILSNPSSNYTKELIDAVSWMDTKSKSWTTSKAKRRQLNER